MSKTRLLPEANATTGATSPEKILVLSDVHANLEALQAVLDHAKKTYGKPDEVWFLGDLVGYGADPVACIKLLNGNHDVTTGVPIRAVKGNHDEGVLRIGRNLDNQTTSTDIQESWRWTAQALAQEKDLLSYLDQLPAEIIQAAGPHQIRLVHASTDDPLGLKGTYLQVPSDVEVTIDKVPEHMCFFGHTHMACYFFYDSKRRISQPRIFPHKQATPIVLPTDKKIFLNPGAVGQPRWGYVDGTKYEGENRASYIWLTYQQQQWQVVCHFVPYPVDTVVKKLSDLRWSSGEHAPDRWIKRVKTGLR